MQALFSTKFLYLLFPFLTLKSIDISIMTNNVNMTNSAMIVRNSVIIARHPSITINTIPPMRVTAAAAIRIKANATKRVLRTILAKRWIKASIERSILIYYLSFGFTGI